MVNHLSPPDPEVKPPAVICKLKPEDHIPCFDYEMNKAMLDNARALVDVIQGIVIDIAEVKSQLAETVATLEKYKTEAMPDTYEDVA